MTLIKDEAYEEEVSTSIAARQKLKINFLEHEKEERLQYISDLEATILINKQIIQELCTSAGDIAAKTKSLIEKLNNENKLLFAQVKNLTKQRNDTEGRALIQSQIIEENRCKEAEHLREFRETMIELKEQLNKKEFIIQSLEKRCCDAEQMIMKYMKNSPEARTVLAQMQMTISGNVGISNVVEQNKLLKAKIVRLTGELYRAKEKSPRFGSSGGAMLASQLDSGQHQQTQEQMKKLREENEALKSQVESLEKESREIRGSNEQLKVELEMLRRDYEDVMRNRKDKPEEVQRPDDNGKSLSEISSIAGGGGAGDLQTDPNNASQDMNIVLELNTNDIKH